MNINWFILITSDKPEMTVNEKLADNKRIKAQGYSTFIQLLFRSDMNE